MAGRIGTRAWPFLLSPFEGKRPSGRRGWAGRVVGRAGVSPPLSLRDISPSKGEMGIGPRASSAQGGYVIWAASISPLR